MHAEVTAWVAGGSNLGDRSALLAFARKALESTPAVAGLSATPIEETTPLGGLAQPPYLNQMFRLQTTLGAEALLKRCHEIERAAGRVRDERWGSRTLDLDLVRYGDYLCDTPELSLPHPGLRDRTFWAREISALESDV